MVQGWRETWPFAQFVYSLRLMVFCSSFTTPDTLRFSSKGFKRTFPNPQDQALSKLTEDSTATSETICYWLAWRETEKWSTQGIQRSVAQNSEMFDEFWRERKVIWTSEWKQCMVAYVAHFLMKTVNKNNQQVEKLLREHDQAKVKKIIQKAYSDLHTSVRINYTCSSLLHKGCQEG